MGEKLTFTIVDVFAERKYAGNQLAVFRGAGGLSDGEMQHIAKEMNYSETTFILSDEPRNGGYDVRIFTPEEEFDFAGHPTLGTSYVIRNQLLGGEPKEVTLNLKVGPIPVRFDDEDGMLWMKQNEPAFGETTTAAEAAYVLGIPPEDIDTRYPIQEVSTGLCSLIVPLKGLSAVKRCRFDRDRFVNFIAGRQAKLILAFSSETYDPAHQLNARVFVDCASLPEDPATGSACGNLASYLVKHRYWGGTQVKAAVEQGYEIGRPSLLSLQAEQRPDGGIDVHVGGRVIPVAKGEWL